jgi:2-phospho-L-lactate guanylyltransferase
MTALPVLIPVNRLDRAKGRLASLLDQEERETLALITFEAVLHAAGPGAVVLTADEKVAKRARGRARVLREKRDLSGLNPQLEAAVAELRASGPARERLLILHADLPLARDEAVAVLQEQSQPDSAVMVESPDGGTNAMLLRPPGKFALAYGKGSFAAHRKAAQAAGMRVIANENRELRLDLDTPEDIRELLRAPRGRQGAAGVFLLSIGIEERLDAAIDRAAGEQRA